MLEVIHQAYLYIMQTPYHRTLKNTKSERNC